MATVVGPPERFKKDDEFFRQHCDLQDSVGFTSAEVYSAIVLAASLVHTTSEVAVTARWGQVNLNQNSKRNAIRRLAA